MDTTDQKSDTEAFRRAQSGNQSQSQALNKVVVQKIPSRLYLGEEESWTPDIESAKKFDSGWEALTDTTHLKLQNFQLVPNNKLKE